MGQSFEFQMKVLKNKHEQIKNTLIFEAFFKMKKKKNPKWNDSIEGQKLFICALYFLFKMFQISFVSLVLFELGSCCAAHWIYLLFLFLVTWTIARLMDVHCRRRLVCYLNGSMLGLCIVSGERHSAGTELKNPSCCLKEGEMISKTGWTRHDGVYL